MLQGDPPPRGTPTSAGCHSEANYLGTGKIIPEVMSSVVERLGAKAGGQETAKEKEKKLIQADADETEVLEAWGHHESKVPNIGKDQEKRSYPPSIVVRYFEVQRQLCCCNYLNGLTYANLVMKQTIH